MHSISVFTRRKMGLDVKVWITMLSCIVLSAGLLGYKVNSKARTEPCKTMEIYVNGRINTDNVSFNVGDLLTFRSPVSPGDKIIWDFNDDSRKEEGFSSVHVFNQEATFRVRATVNGTCAYEKKVVIKKAASVIRDDNGNITESIIGADQSNAGESVSFSTPLQAKSYKWYIDNNQNFKERGGRDTTFRFRSPGTYIVVLILDSNRQKRFTKTIIVSKKSVQESEIDRPRVLIPQRPENPKVLIERPPDTAIVKPPEAPKSKFKYADDEILKNFLQAVVCKKMDLKELDVYLCQGGNTPVRINNKESKNLARACSEIQGKNFFIESVVAVRGEDKDQCVITLKINYDRKRLRNPCNDK